MMKLFDYIKENARILMIILLAIAGVLSATYYVGGMGGNDAWQIISRLTLAVLALGFFGLTITAIILGKTKVANIFIEVLCGYLTFVFVREAATRINFIDDVLYNLTGVFALFTALSLVAIVALAVVQLFNDKKDYNFKKPIRILILVYLILNLVTYLFSVVLVFYNSTVALGFLQMLHGIVTNIAYPLILVVVYTKVFEKEELKAIESKDEDSLNEAKENE